MVSTHQVEGAIPSESTAQDVMLRDMLPHHDEKTGRALLSKDQLVDGTYYVGRCRNATITRWSATHNTFFHWRLKFNQIFIEEIKHPTDENYFDVFRPVRELDTPKFAIPIDVHARFEGNVDDLFEYDREMWSRVVSDPVA